MASPTEASPPSAAWANKDTVPQESLMNLVDGWADCIVLTNQPRRLAQIAGRLNYNETETFVGWWQDERLIKMRKIKTRKRQHRSLTETELKTKLKVDVKKAQREHTKGIFCLSISITKPFGSHQRPQGSPNEVKTTTYHTVLHTYISFLLQVGGEEERGTLALFACSPGFIRSDAAPTLLDAR